MAISRGSCAALLIATVACTRGTAGPTPVPPPPLEADEMGLVVENEGSVDVEAWIGFFGDANRRLGVVPAGTSNSFALRRLNQDFLIVLVVAGSRVLGREGQVVGSPFIEAAEPGDVYYVLVPASGPITYAEGGRPQGIRPLDPETSGFKRWAPTIVVGVALILLLRALLGLEAGGR